MTTIQFLADWGLRSSILILSGALLLWALRVKDPAIRLAAWTAMLFGSLAIPALTAALPRVPLAMVRPAARRAAEPAAVPGAAAAAMDFAVPATGAVAKPGNRGVARFDWAGAAVTIYGLAALALLLRLAVGLAIGLRLKRGSRATGRLSAGIEIRESDRVATPVTLGILRPAIVLPVDWREWAATKLDAVVAHERAHIRRYDPAVQLLSAIHRALLWYSPVSWLLHQRMVRVAEEASDDAAVAASGDRALYAEVLLEFIQGTRGGLLRGVGWWGVPMSRYGRPDQRIHRILDGTAVSRGVTRWSVAAILAMGSPLAYVAAAVGPQDNQQSALPARVGVATAAMVHAEASGGVGPVGPVNAIPQIVAQSAPAPKPAPLGQGHGGGFLTSQPAPAATMNPAPEYLNALGNVTAFYTVTVKPRVDGQLLSVGFKEGELVQAGQLLASIDPKRYELELTETEGQLMRDQATLKNARAELDRVKGLPPAAAPKPQIDAQTAAVAEIEGAIRTDQAKVDLAKLQLTYAQIRAPMTGVAGLRLVDPGNMVHPADAIVVITQLQPIAVLFPIMEDALPQVRARLREGASVPVEAWNRDNSVKLATGVLTAVDNQIDMTTGTAKLKAVFDNKDEALFPNQFVNVHMLMNGR